MGCALLLSVASYALFVMLKRRGTIRRENNKNKMMMEGQTTREKGNQEREIERKGRAEGKK